MPERSPERARAHLLARAGDPAALGAALSDAARANDLPALVDLLRLHPPRAAGEPRAEAAAVAAAWLDGWCARAEPAALRALVAANAPEQAPQAVALSAAALALRLGAALGLCPPCALAPAGTFQMGASPGDPHAQPFERPRHEVALTRAFFVAVTPVTQGQWLAALADHPMLGHNPSGFPGDARRPVERVLWLEANHYCMRLGALLGFAPEPAPPPAPPEGEEDPLPWHARLHVPRPLTSAGPRLPTEAEWEYAARAGAVGPLYAGHLTVDADRLDPALDAVAWYRENALGTTHAVAQKEPNGWGLYDALGNVDEWCWDWDDGAYIHSFLRKRLTDPVGPSEPPYRQARRIRGASWYDAAPHCRLSYRRAYPPTARNQSIGFRFVLTAPPSPAPATSG